MNKNNKVIALCVFFSTLSSTAHASFDQAINQTDRATAWKIINTEMYLRNVSSLQHKQSLDKHFRLNH